MMEPALKKFIWPPATRILGAESTDWQRLSVFSLNLIRMTEKLCFYSAGADVTAFNWPRSKDEAIRITEDQYQMLMQGLEVIARHPIEEMPDPPKGM